MNEEETQKPQSIPGETEDQVRKAAPGEKTKGIIRQALAEQGPFLPIGNKQADGSMAKDIVVRNWTMVEEKKLGERRKTLDDDGDSMSRYVACVLAAMCTSLGGHDFTQRNQLQNEILVGQMLAPDVYYAYVWLRVQSMTEELDLTLTSPNSRKEFEWTGDLRTMMIKSPKTPEDVPWEYTLKRPFEIRKKQITKLQLGPHMWDAQAALKEGTATEAIVAAAIIKASIKRIPELSDDPIILADHELDGMNKIDIAKLKRKIDLNGLGPIMVLEPEDPTVETSPGLPRKTFLTQIDWRYDSFFGDSSR